MRLFNSLLLLAISMSLNAQYFTGDIVYQIKIIPKKPNLNIDSLQEVILGTKTIYYINVEQYKSEYYKNGKLNYVYTYDRSNKKMYDEYTERPYITFRDSRKAYYKYKPSQIFKDSTSTILGHDSYMVVHNSSSGNSKSYYSDDVRIDFKEFEGHQVGNWYSKLKELNGALPLKTITEEKDYISISEAIEINKRRVKKKEFNLPQGKFLVASNISLDKSLMMKQMNNEQSNCYQVQMNIAAKKMGNLKNFTSYINFILDENGQISHVSPYNKDRLELYKVGLEIFKTCGFEFEPGQMDGKPVKAHAVFNFNFTNKISH